MMSALSIIMETQAHIIGQLMLKELQEKHYVTWTLPDSILANKFSIIYIIGCSNKTDVVEKTLISHHIIFYRE